VRFVRWRRLQGEREPGRRARQALALVGEALAATHEPEALLAVILNATIEATGAIGGRLLDGGDEVARVGRLPEDAEHLDLELHDEIGEPGLLQLYAPPQGFSKANVSLARSLAAQASIALQNAHLHRVVERQAATDELTQLANRRAFMDALTTEERRASRSGAAFSVVVADLDDFKRVNDRFGHQTGDDVLRAFAGVIERELREIDLPARIGGEEFALLLPQTNDAGAVALAERIRAAFAGESLCLEQGVELRVTSSFGVAVHAPGESVSALLGAADLALYRAKTEGKNAVVAADRRPSEDRADVR
jgi:diguanylate cyclase (GGDEF)-like protein